MQAHISHFCLWRWADSQMVDEKQHTRWCGPVHSCMQRPNRKISLDEQTVVIKNNYNTFIRDGVEGSSSTGHSVHTIPSIIISYMNFWFISFGHQTPEWNTLESRGKPKPHTAAHSALKHLNKEKLPGTALSRFGDVRNVSQESANLSHPPALWSPCK